MAQEHSASKRDESARGNASSGGDDALSGHKRARPTADVADDFDDDDDFARGKSDEEPDAARSLSAVDKLMGEADDDDDGDGSDDDDGNTAAHSSKRRARRRVTARGLATQGAARQWERARHFDGQAWKKRDKKHQHHPSGARGERSGGAGAGSFRKARKRGRR